MERVESNMNHRFNSERDFLMYIVTNGDVGSHLDDIVTKIEYTPQQKEYLSPWFLLKAVLYGSLGQISRRCYEFDSMLIQMFRERTEFYLDLIPSNGLATPRRQLKEILEEIKDWKIPSILERYCNTNKISFTVQILDMKVTAEEVYELIKEYHRLGRKISNR